MPQPFDRPARSPKFAQGGGNFAAANVCSAPDQVQLEIQSFGPQRFRRREKREMIFPWIKRADVNDTMRSRAGSGPGCGPLQFGRPRLDRGGCRFATELIP